MVEPESKYICFPGVNMKKMAKRWAGVGVLFFLLTSCALKPERPEILPRNDYSYTKEYIAYLIKKEMKKQKVTGLSIALVDDQQVIWSEGFGFADKANHVVATPDTIYRAGSISKLFTATAVMQLVEQGRMDIDKPLKTYLPKFSIKSRFRDAGPITPRNIMTHHSGLPSSFAKGMWTRSPEPFENIVEQIKDDYVAYPPNFIFSYSNLGVTLLGCAVEQVADQSYPSYMDASLLSPLGMIHSSFSQSPSRSPLASKAYRQGKEAEEFPLRDTPAGGLNTTVLDLSRFIEMVLADGLANKRQIIKPETLTEMLHPQNQNVPLDLDVHIGLAWGLSNSSIQKAGLVISHSGATICHHSILLILPKYKLGVVVLANSASAGPVVAKAATETLKIALETKTGIKQPKVNKIPGEVSLPHRQLLTYKGRYETLMGIAEVNAESDYLKVTLGDRTLRLVPHTDGLFYFQYKLLGLIPISLGVLNTVGISRSMIAGHDILVAHMHGQKFLAGEKIQPVPLSKIWQPRIGEYQCVNRGNDAVIFDKLRLRQNNGLLFLDYSVPLFTKKTVSLPLKPISDSEALIYGLGRGKGETIRLVKDGGNELVWYYGYLFKKIRD